MISIYESVKNLFKDNSQVKIQKEEKKSFFLKKDRLCYMSHDEVDELAKILVSWYKLKLSDNVFSTKDGKLVIDSNMANYSNFKNMTFDKLSKKNRNLSFLKCNYYGNNYILNNDLTLDIFTVTGLFNNKIDRHCRILVDRSSGKILSVEGDFLLPKDLKNNYMGCPIERVIELFKKNHNDSVNYSSLVNCVSKRKRDIITRDKIIKKVCLDLLMSNKDNYEYGYYRASFFLKDICNYLDVVLCDDYLQNLISKMSDKDKKKKLITSSKLKKLAIK